MWIFTYKRRMQDANRPTIAVATLLFLLSTAVSIPPLADNVIC
jgi:hypothetical protein